jgi:hypothetical protein
MAVTTGNRWGSGLPTLVTDMQADGSFVSCVVLFAGVHVSAYGLHPTSNALIHHLYATAFAPVITGFASHCCICIVTITCNLPLTNGVSDMCRQFGPLIL